VAAGAARADEAAAWAALRQGGVVALMRHGEAPGVGDPPAGASTTARRSATSASAGRAEARAVGARLRAERIAFGRVVSSPWCRCLDTAAARRRRPGAGRAGLRQRLRPARPARGAARGAAAAVVAAWRGPGVLLVVTHGENIQALTGRTPAPRNRRRRAGRDGALREIGILAPPRR
jgi:broad specificity phosphatase PhoE